MKIFEVESEWLEEYARAREIARDPRNWIRADRGESLLGVVRGRDRYGRAWRLPDGSIDWLHAPPSGWVPDPHNPNGPWIPYPLLGTALQAAYVGRDVRGIAVTGVRLTPEIRVVVDKNGAKGLWKVLSAEVTWVSAVPPDGLMAAAFRDQFEPHVRMWFPLRSELTWEWVALPGGDAAPTSLLIRWYAEHFASDEERGALSGLV